MGLLGLTDTAYAIRFLRLLTMPWEKTAAYKEGVIDKDGKRIKDPKTSDEKNAYTIFHRLVFNLRRLLAKVPLGKSSLARYGAALWLIREHTGLSENRIIEILTEVYGNIDTITEITEARHCDTIYTLRDDTILAVNAEPIAEAGDVVKLIEQVDVFLSQPIYKAKHLKTGATVYVTPGELK